MLALCLLVAGALTGGIDPLDSDVDSLDRALGALTSDDASDRVRGERWLAAHLTTTDFARLAEAALGGEREVETRLVRALGSDDRHLALSVLMASDKNPKLVALGEEAIREIAGRWHTGLGEPLAVDGPNRSELRDAQVRMREIYPAERYRLNLEGKLGEVVERFARLADLPLFLCVDPYTENSPTRKAGRSRVLEGTWDELLLKLAVEYGVNLEGALTTNDKEEVLPLFVCFRPRNSGAGIPTASVLADWCRLSLEDGPLAIRAARALAGCGWPAALLWMNQRYGESEDPVALEGLLLAAGTGRVALTLQRSSTVARLLEEADGAQSNAVAERTMHALSGMLPVSITGERLDELVATDLADLQGRALRLRLGVFEGMTSTSASVRASLRAVLAKPAKSMKPSMRLQALRAWTAVGDGREIQLEGIGRLFGAVENADDGEELVYLLSSAGVAPDGLWEKAANTQSYSVAARAAALEWNLAFGRSESAADYLEGICRWKSGWPSNTESFLRTERVAEVLRQRVQRGDGTRIGHWLESLSSADASGGGPGPAARRALHRIAILSGAPTPDPLARSLSCLSRALPNAKDGTEFSAGDEVLLGVLAASPMPVVSGPARKFLFQIFAESLSNGDPQSKPFRSAERALRGIERCAIELLARGEDLQVELLVRDVRSLIRLVEDHPLRALTESSAWPPGPSSKAIELLRLERLLSTQ